MQFGGIGDRLTEWLRGLLSDGAEALGQLIKSIADLTYWNPHPEINSPSELIMIPEDWGIWYTLWEYHIDIAFPVSVMLLITVWFARQAGVATNILGAEQRVQSNRSLISGIVAVFLSFHAVVVYLNISQLLVTAIAPGADPLANVSLRFAGVGGAAALAIVFLNVSINGIFILALFLINAARIFATFMLPVLVTYAVALHFAQVPLLTAQVKKITKLLASAPLWTIPVAAGWRLMVILGGASPGSQTIGEYIVAEAGLSDIAGSGVAEQLFTTSLFMVPVLIGIIAPLKMTGAASSLFYMSRLAGLSVGKSKGGGSGGDGASGGDGEDGAMGDDGDGSGGRPGDEGGDMPSGGSGSGGRKRSTGNSGSGSGSGGSAVNVNSASTGTDDSLFEDAKDAFNPISGDKEYIDRDKADVTMRAGKRGVGLAEDVTEESIEATKMVGAEARESVSDFLSNSEFNAPEGFDPDNDAESPENPENEPIVNAPEEAPDMGGTPGVPTNNEGASAGGEEAEGLGALFGGSAETTSVSPSQPSTESGEIADMFDQRGSGTGSSTDGFSGDSVSGAVGDMFGVGGSSDASSGVEPGEFINRGQPADSGDIDLGEDEEFDDSAGRWQEYSPAEGDDTRSSESLDWLGENDSLATQLERED
jgi:hypothetical protein